MTEVVGGTASLTEYSLYIDGEWSEGTSGERFESINPFTGEPWATLALAGPEDVDRAVAAARRGFAEWKQMLRKDRGRLLWRLADLIEANAEELAAIETRDNGKLIREMLGQVKSLPDYYRYWAGWADKISGSVLPLDKPGVFHYITREPLGVIACITPWNSPLLLLTWKLAPALATGNAVVVKPSEHASASTVAFCRLVGEAGLPRGLVNVVTGAAETAQALVSHPHVNKVAFTGGGETGRLVAAAAARELTPVSLELGGKSPNIVFEDADIENATKGVMAGIFGASGQTCIAGSRLLVHRSVADELLTALKRRAEGILLGDPSMPETEMGPVCFPEHLKRIGGFVERAREQGATVITGGARPAGRSELGNGLFYAPTIVTSVSAEMEIAQEEIFGPVLAVMEFESDEDAVELANNSRYGLACGVWTGSIDRAMKMSERLEAGIVWINTYRAASYAAPWGGWKESGYGRESSPEAINELTQVKSVWIDSSGNIADPFTVR